MALISETLEFLERAPYVEHRLACPLHKKLIAESAELGGYKCELVVPRITEYGLDYHSYWATIFWQEDAKSPVDTCIVYTSIRAPVGVIVYGRSPLKYERPTAPLLGYELKPAPVPGSTPPAGWEPLHSWLSKKLWSAGVAVSTPDYLTEQQVIGFSCLLEELPEPGNLFQVLFHSGLDSEF